MSIVMGQCGKWTFFLHLKEKFIFVLQVLSLVADTWRKFKELN